MTQELTAKTAEMLAKMKADLDWRGPNGKAMGHIVVTREQAIALMLFCKIACDHLEEVKR